MADEDGRGDVGLIRVSEEKVKIRQETADKYIILDDIRYGRTIKAESEERQDNEKKRPWGDEDNRGKGC